MESSFIGLRLTTIMLVKMSLRRTVLDEAYLTFGNTLTSVGIPTIKLFGVLIHVILVTTPGHNSTCGRRDHTLTAVCYKNMFGFIYKPTYVYI